MRPSTLLQRIGAAFALVCIAATAAAQPAPANTDLTRLSQNAANNSTLNLPAGTYAGQILVENKTLTVVGAGTGRTTLASGRVATIVIVGKGGKLVLRGVSFAPRANEGVAVLVEPGGEATVEQCAVTNANTPMRVTGGVLTLANCSFDKITGISVRATNDAKLTVRNSTFRDLGDHAIAVGTATGSIEKIVVERGAKSGVVAAAKATVTVSESRFADLASVAIGGDGTGPLTVTGSTFENSSGVVRVGGTEPLTVSNSRFESRGKMRVAVETAGTGDVTLDGNTVNGAEAGFILRGEGRKATRIANNAVRGPSRVGVLVEAGKPNPPEVIEVVGNRFLMDGVSALQVRGGVRARLADNLFGGRTDVGALFLEAVEVVSERNIVFAEREALHVELQPSGTVHSRSDLLMAPAAGIPEAQLDGDTRRLTDAARGQAAFAERLATLRQAADIAAFDRAAAGLRETATALRRDAGVGSGDPRRIAVAAPPRSALPLGLDEPEQFHRGALKVGGAFALSFRDVSMPASGMPLELVRNYRSDLALDVGFGPGWGWTFGLRIRRAAPPATHLELVEADGTLTRLVPAGPGIYQSRLGGVDGEVRAESSGYTRVFVDGRRERFDAAGRLIERSSALGRLQVLTYKGDALESIADAGGRRLVLTIANGRVTSVTDGLQRRHAYAYDQAGRLSGVTDPLGRRTSFTYAASGKLAGVALPDQRRIAVEYDANGRASQITGPGELRTRALHEVAATPPRKSQVTLTDGEGRTQVLSVVENPDGVGLTLVQGGGAPTSLALSRTATTVTVEGKSSTLNFDAGGAATQLRDFAGQTHDMKAIARRLADQSAPVVPATVDETGLPLFIELDGQRLAVKFDAAGRLIETRAANGATERFAYDAGDRLVRYQDAAGGVTTREYDAGDRPTRIAEAGSPVIDIRYDAAGLPIEIKPAAGAPTVLAYDRSGLLVSRRTGAELVRYEYDTARRLVAEIDSRGNRRTIEYDKAGKPAAVTTPETGRVAFEYDDNGSLKRVGQGNSAMTLARAADGAVTAQMPDGTSVITRPQAAGRSVVERRRGETVLARDTYGIGGRLERMEAMGSAPIEIAYDSRGRPVERKTPEGSVRYEWDASDRLVRISGSGVERTIVYDAAGRVVEAGSASDKWRLAYGADGRVASLEDGSGWREEYKYDPAGRLAEEKTQHGTRRFTYDDADRIVRVETDDGFATSYRYTDQGEIAERTVSSGGASWRWQYGYDAQGRLVSISSPDGSREAFTYDATGRVASVDLDGVMTRYGYDSIGRIVEIDGKPVARYAVDGLSVEYIDGAGKVSRERFDATGGLVEATDQLGGRVVFERDNNGRVVRRRDPEGRVLVSELDDQGRLVAFGPAGELDRFAWNGAGELASHTRPDGKRIDWQRDRAGEPTALLSDGQALVSWQRDTTGRPTEIASPLGRLSLTYGERDEILSTEDAFGRKLAFRYDAALRLVGITTAEGEQIAYVYDARGELAEQRGPDGQSTRYARDGQGRLTLVTWPGGTSAELSYDAHGLALLRYHTADGRTVERRLARGANGRVTSIRIGERTWRYVYDDSGRLLQATDADGKTSRFAYDGAGNVTMIDGVALAYDAAYRLVRRGDDQARHDANGNLVALGALTLEYDVQGRVVAARRGEVAVTYRYDHAGRLAERRRDEQVWRYLYQTDGRRPVAVYDGTGKRLAWIERGGEFAAVRLHTAAGVGVIAADELGSPLDLANPQVAAAFGRGLAAGPAAGALGYGGAIADAEIGLVFLDARAYLPEIARFVSRDPAGPAGESNPYAYAANDPIGAHDPSGTKYEVPFGPPGVRPNPIFPYAPNNAFFRIWGDERMSRAVLRDLYRMATDPSVPRPRAEVARQTIDALMGGHGRMQMHQTAPHGVGRTTYGSVHPDRPTTANIYGNNIRQGTQDMSPNRAIRRITGTVVHEMTHVAQLHRPGGAAMLNSSRAMWEFEAMFRQWIVDPTMAGGTTSRQPMSLRRGLSEAIRYARNWSGANHVNSAYVERMVRGYFPDMAPREVSRVVGQGFRLANQPAPGRTPPPPSGAPRTSPGPGLARAAGQLDDVARAQVSAVRTGMTAGQVARAGVAAIQHGVTAFMMAYNTREYLNGRMSTASYVGHMAVDTAFLAGLVPSPVAWAYAAHSLGSFLGNWAAGAVIEELADPNSKYAGFLEQFFDLPPIRSHPARGHPCEAITCDCNGIEAGILTRAWRQDCRGCEAGLIQRCLELAQRMPAEAAVAQTPSCKGTCSVYGPGAR